MADRRLPLTGIVAASLALVAAAPPEPTGEMKTAFERWDQRDYAGAVSAWRPLAERGNADAQFNLGQAYKLGRGVPSDMRIAQSWYEKAAQAGHPEAQANLGLILYQNGKKSAAMPWIRKAAERGDPRAQYVYGTELFNGDVIPKDWPRSYAMLQRSAAQGLPMAADSLEKMDKHLSAMDKQKGTALARTIEAGERAPGRPIPAFASAAAGPPPKAGRVAGGAMPGAKPAPAPVPARDAVRAAAEPQPQVRSQPKPTPAPRPAAAGGGWRVQLGAYGSEAAARGQWGAIQKRVGQLAALSPSYEKAGALTRLRAGGLADRGAAERVCGAARAAGQACIAVAPGR